MVDVKKLEKWIDEHPEGAQEPFINVTTQREFKLADILAELKTQEATGVSIVDEELLEVVDQIDAWLKEEE